MNFRASSTGIDEAIKELMVAWGLTRDYWRDVQAVEFEKEFLEPLPLLASQARTVIDEIDGVLRKVRQDCDHQI